MKEFPNAKNNFLRNMHGDKKHICSMFSLLVISHDKGITDSNGCFIKNYVLNFKSF